MRLFSAAPFALLALFLAGCASLPVEPVGGSIAQRVAPAAPNLPSGDLRARARTFVEVAQRVGPAAEDACRRNSPQLGCQLRIVVDDKSDIGANAYQTVDAQGKPIIAVTLPLIAEINNADELAFILSHEAAHHIGGHLLKANQNAVAGAQVFGTWASSLPGASEKMIGRAVNIGAALGSRAYSKDFELEADAIGTFVAAEAGYNPVNGAQFFARIPDPSILSSHPRNAQRFATVEQSYRAWLGAN